MSYHADTKGTHNRNLLRALLNFSSFSTSSTNKPNLEQMNMPRSSDTRNGLPVFGSFLQFLERHPSPLVLTLIVAGFLRLYLLDFFGLSSDEFATSMIVSKHAFDNIIKTCFVIPQPVPPFYFLLCELCVEVLGAGETGLRFLSVICGILTVYLVFLIGKILFDSSVAGCAALLCALNTTQILYAQMARPYALCLLLSSISILSFLRWLKKRHSPGSVQLCDLYQPASLLSLYLFTASAYPRYVLLLVPTVCSKHLSHNTELGHFAIGSCFRDGAAADPEPNSGHDSRQKKSSVGKQHPSLQGRDSFL